MGGKFTFGAIPREAMGGNGRKLGLALGLGLGLWDCGIAIGIGNLLLSRSLLQ